MRLCPAFILFSAALTSVHGTDSEGQHLPSRRNGADKTSLQYFNNSNPARYDDDDDDDNKEQVPGRVHRIVGGTVAEKGEIPYQAALVFPNGDGRAEMHCGGILIAPAWVLSAAHCFPKGENSIVVLGETDLSVLDPDEQRFDIEKVVVHRDYQERSSPIMNDIALVLLHGRAKLTKWVKTIQLPLTADEPTGYGIVSGWGSTMPVTYTSIKTKDFMPNRLQRLALPIVPLTLCETVYNVRDSHICAGAFDEGGKDSCKGDSGGPLVCKMPTRHIAKRRAASIEPEELYLCGIVSYGYGCAQKRKPGVYTRVGHFLEWIKSAMKEAGPDETNQTHVHHFAQPTQITTKSNKALLPLATTPLDLFGGGTEGKTGSTLYTSPGYTTMPSGTGSTPQTPPTPPSPPPLPPTSSTQVPDAETDAETVKGMHVPFLGVVGRGPGPKGAPLECVGALLRENLFLTATQCFIKHKPYAATNFWVGLSLDNPWNKTAQIQSISGRSLYRPDSLNELQTSNDTYFVRLEDTIIDNDNVENYVTVVKLSPGVQVSQYARPVKIPTAHTYDGMTAILVTLKLVRNSQKIPEVLPVIGKYKILNDCPHETLLQTYPKLGLSDAICAEHISGRLCQNSLPGSALMCTKKKDARSSMIERPFLCGMWAPLTSISGTSKFCAFRRILPPTPKPVTSTQRDTSTVLR